MVLRTPLILLALIPASLALGQSAPSSAAPAGAYPPTHLSAAPLPSATLQPSIEVLKTALSTTSVDRWKASPAVRGEAQANLRSIQNDVSSTLPTLLAAADAAPNSPARVLPAYRNADALYDVLLRVVTSAHIAAPADQSSALDQALQSLEDSRRALGDQLLQIAQSQETQIGRLQTALRAVPPPQPAPAAAPVKCPVTPTRKKTAAKPAAKPAP